jgi:predicted porin
VDNSATAVVSHASRVGFKADKKLENGMAVVGQIEWEVDTVGDADKSSADLIKARNSYVGLKGGFGEVRVGIHDTPHKMSTAKLDPLSDTYADYNNVVLTDTRAKNVIAYLNKFGDISVALAYAGGNDAVTAENNGSATSAMIAYSAGPLYLTAATESFADKTAGQTESSNKLGVGYTFGAVTLGLVYDIEINKDAKDDTATYASLQWKVTDAGTIKAAYGQLDYDSAVTKDRTFSAVAYNHKLDKDASVYVLYASGSDNGLAAKGKLSGDGTAAVVGMEFKF